MSIFDDTSIIHNGTCLLCGKPAKEKFYSGSYDSYLTCDCPGVATFQGARETWGVIRREMEDRREALDRLAEYNKLKEQLDRLTKRVNEDKERFNL